MWLTGFHPPSRETKPGTQGRSWKKQRLCKNTAYWLDLHDLFSLLVSIAQDHQARVGSTGPSHISNQSQASLMEPLSQLRLPLLRWLSSLCHISKILSSALCFFSCHWIKYPDKDNIKGKGFIVTHSSKTQSIRNVKSGWQGLEAAGHMKSAIRKLRMINIFSRCSVPFTHLHRPGSQSGNSDPLSRQTTAPQIKTR